jgi:hypothetical protein
LLSGNEPRTRRCRAIGIDKEEEEEEEEGKGGGGREEEEEEEEIASNSFSVFVIFYH